MNPLMQQFLAEGRELIQDATPHLLALEREPADAERIAVVFRVFHTLKGSSGLFDVRPMTDLLHTAEDLLDRVRSGKLAVNAGLIDALLECLDHTGRWLDALEAHDALPAGAGADAAELAARLRRQSAPEGETLSEAAEEAGPDDAPPDALDMFREAERMGALERLLAAKPGEGLFLVEYEPYPGCFFNGDDPLRILRNVRGLAAMKIQPRAPWPAPGELDPFTCSLGFTMLAVGAEAELRDVLHYVFDQSSITAVPASRLIRIRGAVPPAASNGAVQDLARRWRDGRRDGLAEACAALRARLPAESAEASALRWMGWELKHPGLPAGWRDRLAAELGTLLDASPAQEVQAGIVDAILAEQVRLLGTPGQSDKEAAGRRASAATVAVNALRHGGREDEAGAVAAAYEEVLSGTDPDALIRAINSALAARRPALPAAAAAPEPAADDRPAQPGAARVLRVDEARVDRLMRLVGEMVVAKNGLGWLTDMARQGSGDAELMRGLRTLHGSLDRLTREMHGMVLQIRMLPIGQVFQRFPRLVRDLSHRLGKPVSLVLEGEGTEADKAMIEQLFEPILHLVRNSLDHGIEPPDIRAAAGKPAATLTLRAYRAGDRVVVEVTDDGRGIDAAAVRRKAVTNGLLTADQAAALTDAEAIQLIFAPGLSTMDAVSELSGRGVGMYAVRAAMEKAGGAVEVQSEPGAGTTVRLALPLSLTSVRILTVEAGGRRLGVPMDVVAETVRLPRRRIMRIKQNSTFVLRDRVVPLRRLGDLLGLSDLPPPDASADARVLVVEVDGRIAGVEVDNFGERLDVVLKPMDGLLSSIPGYIGTTLLGNGEVLLILDVKEILR